MVKVRDLLKTSVAPWVVGACVLLLSACGQKGPLTLPTPDNRPAPVSPVAPAPTAASAPAR
ncbi:MAG: lipoprotein [Sphaerotilus sp.]|nr:lipoprotein [Sphaerotilus sp.]